MLLVSPFLFTVYPALGLAILAVFGACVMVTRVLLLPVPLEIGVGFVVCVAAFFPSVALEAILSRLALYRWGRALWRLLGAFNCTILLASGAHLRSAGPEVLERSSPGAIVGGIVVAIFVHFLFRALDLVFFPNLKDMRRHAELLAQGCGVTRPLPKRLLYGTLWVVPTMIVMNLLIRVIVELTFPNPEAIHAFYVRWNLPIQLFDVAAWLALCVMGVLPGRGRYRHKPEGAVAN